MDDAWVALMEVVDGPGEVERPAQRPLFLWAPRRPRGLLVQVECLEAAFRHVLGHNEALGAAAAGSDERYDIGMAKLRHDDDFCKYPA